MKLQFEPNLDYQLAAIKAVCDIFRGQELCRTEFTVTKAGAGQTSDMFESDLGLGNRLSLLKDKILENLQDVQLRNGLAQSSTLTSRDFTVEMETGTGKTYVYLRTIFELNKRFGFTKFVIVVPSVAIKEGVYKALQMTQDHFRSLYAGTPCDYFLYDSSKLGQVRNFATSSNIQVMVVTVGAINKKDVNNLYKDSEKTGGERPIDLIKATRPVLIVDEPQSVDGGLAGKGREALAAMEPLCTLRYSATHVEKHHMVYRLDAVDAYERKLVKQIEVAAATIEDAHNKPYVRFVSAANRRGTITAKVQLDVATNSGVRRKEVTVHDGDDLEQTTGREVYANCRIGEIRVPKGSESLELRVPGGAHFLRRGEAFGDVDELAVAREMIRRTIREHLQKELWLRPQGIKVLSLFFIDTVGRYRVYDDEGSPVKGDYARIFEEEYRQLAAHPDYHTLFGSIDATRAAEEVHDGYFSIDRRKVGSKTIEVFKDTRGDTQADDSTYNLIMRDKERLLSLGTPLKFIFSHSALREGWDNPNVFQICGLRDIRSERERRQTIGRGLRLCVNQDGVRIRGFGVNTLTVIATESYEQFAENLQKEIEVDTGIRFGVVESHQFAAIATVDEDGHTRPLGAGQSQLLWDHLKDQKLIDSKGRIQDSLRETIQTDSLELPDAFAAHRESITEVLRKLAGRLDIKNADERRPVRPRQAVLHSEEFRALWDRIKHKTTYRVEFDNDLLIKRCVQALQNAPPVPRTRLQWRTANLSIGKSGIDAGNVREALPTALEERDIPLPDLLTELQDRTQLTRRSIHRILVESDRLADFRRNPQRFIDVAADAINRCKRLAIVDGIKYQRLGDDSYYAQELFEQDELSGYLKNMLATRGDRCVYDHVLFESDTERNFADQLERNEAVRVYAKLPGWFKVPTPLGSYNPDWAVLARTAEGERLYFVVETKGSLNLDDLRDAEAAKIVCGKAHFAALEVRESPAIYKVARNLDDVLST